MSKKRKPYRPRPSKHASPAPSVKPQSEDVLVDLLESTENPFLLVLDQLQDPQNLGACLRTADAAGVHAVIEPKDRSAPLSRAAVEVARGAAEHVPLIRVTNLARTLRQLREARVFVVGTDDAAERSLYEADLTGPLALVMGAEGSGLRRLTRETCDLLISIPMTGHVGCLNVSVAAGVCLFEAVRQRR